MPQRRISRLTATCVRHRVRRCRVMASIAAIGATSTGRRIVCDFRPSEVMDGATDIPTKSFPYFHKIFIRYCSSSSAEMVKFTQQQCGAVVHHALYGVYSIPPVGRKSFHVKRACLSSSLSLFQPQLLRGVLMSVPIILLDMLSFFMVPPRNRFLIGTGRYARVSASSEGRFAKG